MTALFVAGALVSLGWLGLVTHGAVAPHPPAQPGPTKPTVDLGSRDEPAAEALRPRKPTTRTSVPMQQPTRLGFDAWVERLVELGVEAWSAVDRGDDLEARSSDAEARAELAALRRTIPESDERALHALTGLTGEDVTLRGRMRRTVLLTLIRVGLDDRHDRAQTTGDRTRADHLVTQILAALPQDEALTADLAELLIDRPHLGIVHEGAVLEIVELATEDRYLVPVAEPLLRTLWHNLADSGARTSEQLTSLALVFLDDANPSRRLAALRQLLCAEDGRFEEFVVDRVLTSGDSSLANALAVTAANEVAPPRAARILERLMGAPHARLSHAYVSLGRRALDTVRAEYESCLGNGTRPKVRAELVTAAGFGGGDVTLARDAFRLDPDVAVRVRALYVLAARAGPEQASRYLVEAVSDEGLRDSHPDLGFLVSALRNLAGQGDPNAVQRAGRAIAALPDLSAQRRAELDQILREHLPGGG